MGKDIVLKSEELEIIEVVSKTKAKMFKDLGVGDKINLSIIVDYAGSNRGSTYASYITCESNGNVVYKSFNELPRLLDCFKFK